MKSGWKEAPFLHKIVAVVSVFVGLSVVVLGLLQVFNLWNQASNVCVPLLGVNMICQALLQWNTSRKVAYFSIGTAGFMFICAIVVFFCK